MANTYEGSLDARDLDVAIVVSRFNGFITKELLAGGREAFRMHGGSDDRLTVAWVPGGFELPQAARKLASTGRYAAVVALGAVIRGATPHFDLVAGEAALGIAAAGAESGVPMLFGVLTTDSVEQAIERAGTKAGNKGFEAVAAAIEMATLFRRLEA